MTFDYSICPHCGCRCEDIEYCAACSRMFHEDQIPGSDVSVLKILGNGLRSLATSVKSPENQILEVEEDLEFDSSWSCLSSNIYNTKR